MNPNRYQMYNDNPFKLGLFGANCSSGRSINKLPERWLADWDSCERMAKMADEGGIDFILPIGRWRGYGGETDFHGTTLETITWATGLLARTERVTVFGTVHAPLFNPMVAAKQIATADHIGHGRFGLNIVVGWNEPEFQMAGIRQREHDDRYAFAEEWISAIKKMWNETEPFDFDEEYLQLQNVVAQPKLYAGSSPLIINAGRSETGRAFALRHCHAFFTNFQEADIKKSAEFVARFKADANALGRDTDVYTQGHVICRPTRKEAEEYFHYLTTDGADFEAVEALLELSNITRANTPNYDEQRRNLPVKYLGYPIVGSPDDVTEKFSRMHAIGLSGIAFSLVNYVDELPLIVDEVIPRLRKGGHKPPDLA